MRVAAFVLAALTVAGSARAQSVDPLGPREEPQFSFSGLFAYYGSMCDCDVREFAFRTLVPLRGHADPDPSSPVVRTVGVRRLIEGNDWDVQITVVTAASTGTLRQPYQVTDARRIPDSRRDAWGEVAEGPPFTLPAGTRVTMYDRYADQGFFHIDGATYYATLPTEESNFWEGTVDWQNETETWFRLVPRGGAPAAWVQIGWRNDLKVQILCATHDECAADFTPTYRP